QKLQCITHFNTAHHWKINTEKPRGGSIMVWGRFSLSLLNHLKYQKSEMTGTEENNVYFLGMGSNWGCLSVCVLH
uniref:Uncharacterized protein n=1 Tax=Xiphophorus maculatus TaxID=8083 RepID=A0A3B5QKM1_XIPMA